MAVTLNASTSSGLVQTADTSGVLTLQSNGTDAVSISGSNLQFNSGYGSVATAYGCRAWVNFNGTGTVAIRASGNVSSITDNGVGDYTVNFTNAVSDTNYSTIMTTRGTNVDGNGVLIQGPRSGSTYSTTAVRVSVTSAIASSSGMFDADSVYVAIFR
jgi:hypothetical protein